MGRIIAISSGDLKSTEKINQYIVNLVVESEKNLLFLGTASQDNDNYINRITEVFAKLGCNVKSLSLTSQKYSDQEIDEMIDWANIIYVGGGDTFYMIDVWKKYGIEAKLRKVYKDDSAILTGISAGAICWFHLGHSDSEIFWVDGKVNYGWVDHLLDIHPYAFCPHYEERKDSFPEMLKETELVGLAMESDTAFVENNGCISFIKCNSTAKAYWLQYIDGQLVSKPIEMNEI